jgi:hypothetical protein
MNGNLIFILLFLIMVGGGVGLYYGGPAGGAVGIGVILIISLAFYYLGGFSDRNV